MAIKNTHLAQTRGKIDDPNGFDIEMIKFASLDLN